MQFDLGEFGDGNPYTVFSHDLKSVLTSVPNAAWGSLAIVGSGLDPLVSDRGTKFQDINGDETGYRFITMAAELAQTHYEGHAKIRGEKKWACSQERDNNGNGGDALASQQNLLTAVATTGGIQAILSRSAAATASATAWLPKSGGGVTQLNLDYRNQVIGSTAVAMLHTAGKDDDVDVDIFWKGDYGFFAVDGVIVNATNLRNTNTFVNWLNNLYLGSDRGVAGTFCKDHWFSNFEIRTKCPEFSLNYVSRLVGVLSDSLFDNVLASSTTSGDVAAEFRLQRKFNLQGQYVNINISENAGYRIYNTGSNWLGDPTPIAASLANNPVEVYVSGGTNDAVYAGTEITSVQFQTAYLDILEKLLGENGNDATGVERVKMLIPIPLRGTRGHADYETWVTRAAGYRAVINALPALWDATYPARARAVTTKDWFTPLGGESNSKGDDLYIGDVDGSLTNLHLAAHGNQIAGDNL